MDFYQLKVIRDKKISVKNLLEIASVFEAMVSKDGGESNFEVKYKDGSELSGAGKSIINSERLVAVNVSSVKMSYKNKTRSHAKIELYEHSLFSDKISFCEICSPDHEWFEENSKHLAAVIEKLKAHCNLRKLFSFPYVIISFFVFCVAFIEFLLWGLGFEYVNELPPSEGIFISAGAMVIYITNLFIAVSLLINILLPKNQFSFNSIGKTEGDEVTKRDFAMVIGLIIFQSVITFFVFR